MCNYGKKEKKKKVILKFGNFTVNIHNTKNEIK